MVSAPHPSLQYFLNRYSDDKTLAALGEQLGASRSNADLLDIYQQAVAAIEQKIWTTTPDDADVSQYQQVFQEMEKILADNNRGKKDDRYKFYIIIPVADRPIHLQQCLNSLLAICQLYQYGGTHDQVFTKVAVIVADDSKKADSIDQHKQICAQFSQKGLQTEYFGVDEQIEQIEKLHSSADQLQQIFGHYITEPDPENFYHKGAAITRNMAYLRLNQISKDEDEKIIFYFIDSDQEFKIKIATDHGQKDIYAINYLYHLNEIFRRGDTCILTGKVVGDPPVSPAVMAGNFQNDVIDFLRQIASDLPASSCHFHGNRQISDDAAYHDMADLFGFKKSDNAFLYSCTLPGQHNHIDCFNDFAGKLNHFFDGEHPTRATYFDYGSSLTDTIPARTIYTGNYAFSPECLKYFISFATLKLRMAGPVLGRIIKAEIGDRFVSANLPMLHKRTTDQTGESEFRPGVNREHNRIDLSNEFERQFFGDVMLFTIEKLNQHGYPARRTEINIIEQALEETEQALLQKYETRHQQTMAGLTTLKSIFNDDKNWWHHYSECQQANQEISRFIDNIENNFGENSTGYVLINNVDNRKKRHEEILQAIMSYKNDRALWETILK